MTARRNSARSKGARDLSNHRTASLLGRLHAASGDPPEPPERFRGHGGSKAHAVYVRAYEAARKGQADG